MKLKKYIRIFSPLAIGGLVSLILKDKIGFDAIIKPPLTPPKIIFPIAWIILYTCIGYAYYIYHRDTNKNYLNYYLGLFLNYLWTFVFFLFKNYLLSLAIIILLDISVFINLLKYKKVNKKSFYLLLPYLLWLLFATYLNFGVYRLN